MSRTVRRSTDPNPTCGDGDMESGCPRTARPSTTSPYDGQGCSISQASTSVLTDQVIGQSVGDALRRWRSRDDLLTGNVGGTRMCWAMASPS